LDVGAILEGSVRKAGNRVRISAQLIEVDADKYVWSQSFDRDITDVFGVQGEIAQRVAEALKVQLLSKEKERLEAGTTRSPEAYTLYLKGRFFWNERTEEGVKRAVKYFEEALAADAGFAKAYSGLADCYLILADYGWMAPAKAGELAKDNAMKALALDGSLAEAHASLGLVHVNHDWDFLQGEKEFKRAIELNPNYVSAYHWYSVLLVFLRRYEDSHRMIMRAKALDPYSLVIGQSRAVALIGLGRYDEAVDQLNRVLEESPDLVSAHYWLATTKLVQGKYPEAVEEAKREVAGDKYDRGAKLDLAFAHSEAGNKEEGSRLLEEVLSEKEAYYSPTTVGVVLLSLGREKEASEWMDRAFEERDSALLYFRSLPVYRGYLAFPGWSEIERKIGYPVETSPTS
jgi:tetratricopeptide (TPR) repeat protein